MHRVVIETPFGNRHAFGVVNCSYSEHFTTLCGNERHSNKWHSTKWHCTE
jgi:hypothetical protein